MVRSVVVAVALLAFAFGGVATAECGAAHQVKQTITDDQQVKTDKAPTAKVAKKAARKDMKVACEGKNCDAASAKQVVEPKPHS